MSLYAISGFCFPGLCTESVPPPSFDPISGWQPNYETFTNLGGAALYGVSLADSIVPDLDTRNIPIAILNGTEDGITTTDDAWAAYQQLELERAFVTVGGANHCGICDVDKPEGAQLEDDGEAILDQIEANFYVARWLGFWYRAELKDDRCLSKYLSPRPVRSISICE
jgi:hypothetical protein